VAKSKPVVSIRKPPSADAVAAFVAAGGDAPAPRRPSVQTSKRKGAQAPTSPASTRKTRARDGAELRRLTLWLPAELHRELAHATVDRDCTLADALAEGARLWLRSK
jgi:hypothetical protein